MGALTLDFENLHLTDGTNHRMLLYSAPESSPSDAALRMLSSLTAGPAATGHDTPKPASADADAGGGTGGGGER
ncbi:hypothetical protein ACH4U5_05260 [Streptomyces sp. NPDC020858]|uniref:hypothetical protein n=1 Tax=Streptomyces sp. NPDC020858 TaxID=3365097 RepID=UPI003798950F